MSYESLFTETMGDDHRGTFVVGLRHADVDVEDLRKVLLKVVGITSVEFNYLTRKLTVKYNGAHDVLELINEKTRDATRVSDKTP